MLQRWRKIKKKCKQQHSAGFLLVQLGVVLGLLVLIVSLVVSQSDFISNQVLHAEVEKLLTVFRYFQQKACVTQTEQRLVFDERTASYSCSQYKQPLPFGIKFGFISPSYGPPSKPETLINQSITFKNKTVTFLPDGSISSGTLYLTNAQKSVMYAITVPVSCVSFLRQYRYDTKAWTCLS